MPETWRTTLPREEPKTAAQMQRALVEEIADDAHAMFSRLVQHGTIEGLDEQFDEQLGTLRGKVNLLHSMRWVLKRREADRC